MSFPVLHTCDIKGKGGKRLKLVCLTSCRHVFTLIIIKTQCLYVYIMKTQLFSRLIAGLDGWWSNVCTINIGRKFITSNSSASNRPAISILPLIASWRWLARVWPFGTCFANYLLLGILWDLKREIFFLFRLSVLFSINNCVWLDRKLAICKQWYWAGIEYGSNTRTLP